MLDIDNLAARKRWRSQLPHALKALQRGKGPMTNSRGRLVLYVSQSLLQDFRLLETITLLEHELASTS